MTVRYRIVQADTHEPIELDGGRVDADIEEVEAEIRKRPERFVLRHTELYAPPLGLIVQRIHDDYDGAMAVPLSETVRHRLELVIVQALARNVIDIWRGGPSLHDREEFEDAVAKLADVLPPKQHAPITHRPDDAF